MNSPQDISLHGFSSHRVSSQSVSSFSSAAGSGSASPESYDLIIRGRVLAQGSIAPRVVAVSDGIIAKVWDDPQEATAVAAAASAAQTIDLADEAVLIPGIVDTHVHINEPGRTEWEGFDYATRAAAAGGVTTVIDMPLNSNPPTMTVEALNIKLDAARNKAYTELGFWGGVDSSNIGHLKPLWDAGVFGFKCFLSPSGVDEYGSLRYDQVRTVMEEIKSFGGTLIIHSEDPDELTAHAGHIDQTYRSFVDSRPGSSEADAVAQIAKLVAETGCRTHILHVSSGQTVGVIADAKKSGLPLSAETCPHYLTLDCNHIPDGDTAFKCCPPIRDKHEQDQLWQGLADGVLDIVVTDHSPTTAQMKSGPLATAWGGVSSLQVGFRAVLTEAKRRGFALPDVVRWMSAGSAQFVGLNDRGEIAPGKRADLVVLRPDESFTVHASELLSRNPISAFDGATLDGIVGRVLIGGVEPAARPSNLITRP
ncbi:allantoinase AllB [Bifidobacterium subtile]|jgi:allantoinase|uniref:allantoinase n=1 Tax=Bifidobacterium subtile TaxID=77635 RepID=A0A087E789_9BIFI|nr:allantoinase AllB [Bifidobacterium subtile]KFJ03640.1 allantoinase [Bifidobacterium subtile]QOL36273.1 allantoinase AllB [Bifidobacterium subtile]